MRWLQLLRSASACGLVGALVLATAACATRAVDLGANETTGPIQSTGKESKEAGATRLYGCVDWLDEEIASVRGNGCESLVCPAGDATPGARYDIRTAKDVVAVTANRWMFCGARPEGLPVDAVGMEFTAGCRIYFLRRDKDERLVRGTEAAYQASFDIDVPDLGPAAIDLHFDRGPAGGDRTTRFGLSSAKCPQNWLRLEAGEQSIPLRPVNADDLVPPAF